MADFAALASQKQSHVHHAGCSHHQKASPKEQPHKPHAKEGSGAHHHHAAHHAQKQLGHICSGGCHHGAQKTSSEHGSKDSAASHAKNTAKPSQHAGEKSLAAQSAHQAKTGQASQKQASQEGVPTKKPAPQGSQESASISKQTILDFKNAAPKAQRQASSPQANPQNASSASRPASTAQKSATQQSAAKFLPTSPQAASSGKANASSNPSPQANPASAKSALPGAQAQALAQQPLQGLKGFLQANAQGVKNFSALGFVPGQANLTAKFSQGSLARPISQGSQVPLKSVQGLTQETSLPKNMPLNPLAIQSMGALAHPSAMGQTGMFAALNGSLKNLSSLLFGQYRFVQTSNLKSSRNEALLQSLSALLIHSQKRKSEKKLKKKDLRKIHQKDSLYLEEIDEEAVAQLDYLAENQPLLVQEKDARVALWQANHPSTLEKSAVKRPYSKATGKPTRPY